ncbi:methyltransferase domain-containing protein [Streptomyces sp. NPDC002144]
MSSQELTVADGNIDVVVSRMGLLSSADPLSEAGEVARVLRPGGTAPPRRTRRTPGHRIHGR